MGGGGSSHASGAKDGGKKGADHDFKPYEGFYAMPNGQPIGPLSFTEITTRIDMTPTTETTCCGIPVKFAAVSLQGYYPYDPLKPNQDAYIIEKKVGGIEDYHWFLAFDGHGGAGHEVAQYSRDNLPGIIKDKIKAKGAANMTPGDLPQMIGDSHVEVNSTLHEASPIDDMHSGTTATSVFVAGKQMFVSNVGDSRTVVGSVQDGVLMAQALTHDQTLYRKDERERVKAAGARVLSIGMLEGEVPVSDDFDCGLGDEIDEEGDPPRLWLPFDALPGCAFSRSIGDHVAETIGCVATPEILGPRDIQTTDRYMIIASDGVWEFLTNKTVINMVSQYTDPLEACHAVVAESYKLWLSREERSDDITMICLFLNEAAAGSLPGEKPAPNAATAAAPSGPPPTQKQIKTRRGSMNTSSSNPPSPGGGDMADQLRQLQAEQAEAEAETGAEM